MIALPAGKNEGEEKRELIFKEDGQRKSPSQSHHVRPVIDGGLQAVKDTVWEHARKRST